MPAHTSDPEQITIENSRLAIDLRGETDLAPLVSLIVASGAQVEEVRKGKASLEEVFLTLMQEDSETRA